MTSESNRRDRERMDAPSVKVTVREQGGGILFGVAGLVLGIFAVYELFSLIPAVIGALSECIAVSDLTLGTVRTGALIAVAAGVAAVALSEVGVRREMKPKFLGAIGSVLGIFAVIAGGGLFVMMLVPSLSECFTA